MLEQVVMSAASALVSMEEYLSASYQPDADYVEGCLVERAMPGLPHSICQREILFFLRSRKKDWGVSVYPEQRVQVSPSRFRVPDLSITRGPAQRGREILTEPPLLVIEILSPEDSFPSMMDRVNDYQRFLVPHIWVVDPEKRNGWTWNGTDPAARVEDGVFRASGIVVPLRDLDWE